MSAGFWTRLRWWLNGLAERFRDPRCFMEDWEAGIYCDADGNRVAANRVYRDGSGLLRYRGSNSQEGPDAR